MEQRFLEPACHITVSQQSTAVTGAGAINTPAPAEGSSPPKRVKALLPEADRISSATPTRKTVDTRNQSLQSTQPVATAYYFPPPRAPCSSVRNAASMLSDPPF